MDGDDWLAERFEENRPRLRAVAYRMLGSSTEAEDAVQESWIRLSRADTSDVQNLGGWLTTVVARVCLDMLRSRQSRREDQVGSHLPEAAGPDEGAADPEYEAVLADSVGPALLVMLETLTPAERLAFVLHDLFDVPFDEVGEIVGRTPVAARQLASRARRRVRGATTTDVDPDRQRAIVDAFLAAARNGDFDALLAALDPDVVVRADPAAVAAGAEAEVRGADAAARTFAGRAQVAKLAMVDGTAGLVFAPGGRPRVVFDFTITGGKIVEIGLIADPDSLAELDLVVLDD